MRSWLAITALWLAGCPAFASEPFCTWRVHRQLVHDPNAFTQGLTVADGTVYESTGLYGQSSVRRIDLESGNIELQVDLPAQFFAEGMVAVDAELYVVTWREQTAMVLERDSFALKRTFRYRGEGWGLDYDGQSLILSDGSSKLSFIDPKTAKVTGQLEVVSEAGPVSRLNELEYIDGSIFANIWQTETIAKIDASTGRVVAWLDMQGLLGPRKLPGVLNGIASIDHDRRLLVTGKNWPAMFEIDVDCPGGDD